MESRKICCSVCKTNSKSEYYLCKTGRHIICENCQHGEPLNNRCDDGDYVPESEPVLASKNVLSSVYNGIDRQDLSSGDHSTHYEHYNINSNRNNISERIPTCPSKTHCSNCNKSTIVVYRNEKFHNGKSRIDPKILFCMNELTAEQDCEITRPVVCPVSSCAKIVTIDTMSQHFNFDHSKIPRLMLYKNSPHEILLKYSTLSAETKCIAVFTISTEKRSSYTALKRVESRTSVHNFDSQLLLLMAAKLSTELKSEPCSRKCGNSIQDVPRQKVQNFKLHESKSNPVNSTWMNKVKDNSDESEILLLWLCKLNDKSKVYTINVSRNDKRQGYSYIGDAVHIKHEQNPNFVYNRTECISIRKAAINKLITAENELKVIVSRVQ